MTAFFHTVLYVPIYNLLMFLVDIVGGDLGLAVVLATIAVRFIIWPLSMSAARSQKAMKAMQPELKEVQERNKDDREAQMKEMMALYKKYDIHPFASLLPVFVQLPIVIGLYWVFSTKMLTNVNLTILYPLVAAPVVVSTLFLGHFDITGSSIVLAILTTLTQAAHAFYAIPIPPPSTSGTRSSGDDLARMMAVQMRYVLPVIIGFVAYTSGAVALYLITSSLVSILQEFMVRRTVKAPVVA